MWPLLLQGSRQRLVFQAQLSWFSMAKSIVLCPLIRDNIWFASIFLCVQIERARRLDHRKPACDLVSGEKFVIANFEQNHNVFYCFYCCLFHIKLDIFHQNEFLKQIWTLSKRFRLHFKNDFVLKVISRIYIIIGLLCEMIGLVKVGIKDAAKY